MTINNKKHSYTTYILNKEENADIFGKSVKLGDIEQYRKIGKNYNKLVREEIDLETPLCKIGAVDVKLLDIPGTNGKVGQIKGKPVLKVDIGGVELPFYIPNGQHDRDSGKWKVFWGVGNKKDAEGNLRVGFLNRSDLDDCGISKQDLVVSFIEKAIDERLGDLRNNIDVYPSIFNSLLGNFWGGNLDLPDIGTSEGVEFINKGLKYSPDYEQVPSRWLTCPVCCDYDSLKGYNVDKNREEILSRLNAISNKEEKTVYKSNIDEYSMNYPELGSAVELKVYRREGEGVSIDSFLNHEYKKLLKGEVDLDAPLCKIGDKEVKLLDIPDAEGKIGQIKGQPIVKVDLGKVEIPFCLDKDSGCYRLWQVFWGDDVDYNDDNWLLAARNKQSKYDRIMKEYGKEIRIIGDALDDILGDLRNTVDLSRSIFKLGRNGCVRGNFDLPDIDNTESKSFLKKSFMYGLNEHFERGRFDESLQKAVVKIGIYEKLKNYFSR